MNESVASRFIRLVDRLPEKIAIVSDDRSASYSELDARSNAVAQHLLEINTIRPGRVALLFSDRIDSLAAILGVLKTGDAYVMLDADDPDERVRFILEDCAPYALITGSVHLERARALAGDSCQLIGMDDLEQGFHSRHLPEVLPEAMAYMFYTSGSTGKPKGVCHSHRNLLYFIDRYSDLLGICEDDRLSLLYSLSFSASNMDIYGGLLNGASVHVFDVRRNGIGPLAEWLEREQVSILHTVPTVFRQLTTKLDPQWRFEHVRVVDLGGETAFASDAALFRCHFRDDCRLFNRLASTEVMMMAQYCVSPEQEDGLSALPVGRGPEGIHVCIRRSDGSEAETGDTGAIEVSSQYVSLGYWRRPELTATHFADDLERPGWRIYRSGDMGSIDLDGNLRFLGRSGTRVKIRGQSIDLTEVEAGLHQCEAVQDAVVIHDVDEKQPDTERLVAYVVTRENAEQDAHALRSNLTKQLPLYMLPAHYVFLDSLPMTATGKVDRLALPKPESLIQQGEFQPPADDLEREIAAIFEKVLKYSPAGRNDDFFLMGGDSMSVMELKLNLSELFGNNDANVLDNSTVAGIAELNRHLVSPMSQEEHLMPLLVPLRKKGDGPVLFLVHGRLGQAHISPNFLEILGGNQAIYSFQAKGVDGIQAPNETLEAMARDYLSAMRQLQPEGPYFLGGLCAGGYVAIEMARMLMETNETVFPLLLVDPPLPYFLPEGAEFQLRTLPDRIRKHSTKGHFDFGMENSRRLEGANRVAESFEKALLRYQPQPYSGAVFLLANTQRLSGPAGWKTPSTQRRMFAGKIACFEVGAAHNQILDVTNEHFKQSIRMCINAIHSDRYEEVYAAGTALEVAPPDTPQPVKTTWSTVAGQARRWS